MLPSLASLLVLLAPAASLAGGPGDDESTLQLESRLIATLPEGVTLDFPPVRIGSAVHQRGRVLRWGPLGHRVAYIGIADGEEQPFIGEESLGSFDFVAGPYFAEESAQCLFRVGNRLKKKDRERWWLLLDGEEVFEEDWIGSPAISDDGELISFWSQPGARIDAMGAYNQGLQVLHLLERKGKKFKQRDSKKCSDAMSLVPPTIVDDRALSFARMDDFARFSVVEFERGKRKMKELDELDGMAVRLATDPDGKHWGAAVQEASFAGGSYETTHRVVVDGELVAEGADQAFGPWFSGHDKRVAVVVQRDGRFTVETTEQPRAAEYQFAAAPVLGPDDQLAFTAVEDATIDSTFGIDRPDLAVQGGRWFVVRRTDGEADRPEEARWDEIKWLTFSPDGERLAYVGRRGDAWHVVLDGIEGPRHDDAGRPRFSDDSETLVHGARAGRELWWKVWEPAKAAPAANSDD